MKLSRRFRSWRADFLVTRCRLSPGFAAQTIRQYSKFASTSPVPVVVRPAISWPVVRLDNASQRAAGLITFPVANDSAQIPWDVTVNEVEQWLPADSLAPLESCVMAVHILCNRCVAFFSCSESNCETEIPDAPIVSTAERSINATSRLLMWLQRASSSGLAMDKSCAIALFTSHCQVRLSS